MGVSAKFVLSNEANAQALGSIDSNGRVTIQNLGPNEVWIYTTGDDGWPAEFTAEQKVARILDEGLRISSQQERAIENGINGVRLSQYFLAVASGNTAQLRMHAP